MDHNKGWFRALLMLNVIKLEDRFVTKYESSHADNLCVTEAEDDIFALDVLQWNLGQF